MDATLRTAESITSSGIGPFLWLDFWLYPGCYDAGFMQFPISSGTHLILVYRCGQYSIDHIQEFAGLFQANSYAL